MNSYKAFSQAKAESNTNTVSNFFGFTLVRQAALLVLLVVSSGWSQTTSQRLPSASRVEKQTLFGTLIWGRNCTGQPHWLDGSVYPGIDGQSYLKNMLYVPLDSRGLPAATSSDPAKLKKGSYDCALLEYWVDQVRQMQEAGLDWVAIDSFGDRMDLDAEPQAAFDPKQDKYVIPSMVKGIREAKASLKICLLDDTPSHAFTHRLERLRKQFPNKDANGRPEWYPFRYDGKKVPDQPLLVSAEMGRKYLAGKWIAAYESMGKDQDLWLTHNHLPPSQGGRPVIFMYGTGPAWFEPQSTKSFMHEAFATAKQEFKKRFGVEPFLIVDKCYVDFCPEVKTVADGLFLWVPTASKNANNDTKRKTDFTNPNTGVRTVFGFVMPGFEWLNKELAHCARRRRWIALDGSEGDEKHLLTSEFGQVMEEPKPDYVMIGHWNDFQEGQNFGRALYPAKSGLGFLPHDYYLRAVRQLIDASRSP